VPFEGFAKGRMAIVPRRQCNLRNVHGPHPKFSPGAFQAHATDVGGNILADAGCEDAMKVGHRKTGHGRQRFTLEWFVKVLADVPFDSVDALRIALEASFISRHTRIIASRNIRSLLQMYHAALVTKSTDRD
jgi:hypothetical protein